MRKVMRKMPVRAIVNFLPMEELKNNFQVIYLNVWEINDSCKSKARRRETEEKMNESPVILQSKIYGEAALLKKTTGAMKVKRE